jgi:hypothetical protein
MNMKWLRENSGFLLFFIVFLTVHLFGHGKRDGRGGHIGNMPKRERQDDAQAAA